MSTRVAKSHAHFAVADVSTADRVLLENFIAASAPDSSVALLLQRVLSSISRGADLDIFENDAELTPNQAAELLKMSRPHLLKFMDRGDLPYHRVGSHRRIIMSDLMEFASAREAGARVVADALGHPEESSDIGPESNGDLDELDDM